jgi:hypothetical protein
MRALVLVALAGCIDGTPPYSGPPTPVSPIEPGTPTASCSTGAGCSAGLACARDGVCYPPSELRAVHVSWTVHGMAASTTTCNPKWVFEVAFYPSHSGVSTVAFSPVPCESGRFTVDLLPKDLAEAGAGDRHAGLARGPIDATTGEATLDIVH